MPLARAADANRARRADVDDAVGMVDILETRQSVHVDQRRVRRELLPAHRVTSGGDADRAAAP